MNLSGRKYRDHSNYLFLFVFSIPSPLYAEIHLNHNFTIGIYISIVLIRKWRFRDVNAQRYIAQTGWKPYLLSSKPLVFSTLPCFSARFHSILPQHSGTDIVIVILKIKKELQGDDFMKVTQEAFHTLI